MIMSPVSLPSFTDIDIPTLPERLEMLLNDNRARIEQLASTPRQHDWQSLMAPLEELDDRLGKFWSPVSHLNGVMNSEQLRKVYDACLPLLTRYYSDLGQNRALYQAVSDLAASPGFDELTQAQRQAVNNMLRDFRLSGVALEEADRERYTAIQQRLSELSTAFSNHVLDATDGWEKWIDNEAELAGVPETALQHYRQQAEARGREGFRLSLDLPAYLPILQYADNRELRRELYEANATRASELGPNANRWDNGPLMVEILALRAELAQLLGFGNYAELSIEPKMAESPQQVLTFLEELAQAAKPQAEQELAELQAFARAHGCATLEAWDVAYYSEKLREQSYAISQEQLRPYFPVDTVMKGLFSIARQLFGLGFEPEHNVDLWHPDARCYRVLKDGAPIAHFYIDLYAREKKRGGAWMADYCGRRRSEAGIQQPVAFLVCNFTPPTSERPALLTHNEVLTLFHEFGHGIHHMLTEVDVLPVSGIHGVAWDAVELPSQFLENWCWEREAIPLLSGHYQSGEPLPEDLLDRMLAAKNFQSGMTMVRQLEFALFDLKLHMLPTPVDVDRIQRLIDDVRQQVAVIIPPAFHRFQNSFSHIFAGGYAAGYYSYKWAEVLSADAFSVFEEEGVMNPETGRRFRDEILARGGSEDAMTLFVNFRGREPSQEALLRHSGIRTDRAA